MADEIVRRGSLRPITDLPTADSSAGGRVEVEIAGKFFSVAAEVVGGGDPALAPRGTEIAAKSSEFNEDDGKFSWLNQGTSTKRYYQSRVILTPEIGGAGVNNMRLLGLIPPAAPWAAQTRMILWNPLADQGGGLFARRSANSRIHTANLYTRTSVSGGTMFSENWAVLDWSSFTALANIRFGPAVNDERARDRFIQIRNDGTSLYFDFAPDNSQFVNVQSTTLATYLGGDPDFIGVIANDPTAAGGASIGYDWFRMYANANLNQG